MMHRLQVINFYKDNSVTLLSIKWREFSFNLFNKEHLGNEIFCVVLSKVY